MIMSMLKPVWRYRGFIAGSVKREFQSKYRNSLLGAIWTVLNPLAMIVIYTVVFSRIMHARLPGVESDFAYSIYLCAGILTWGLFSEIIDRGQNVFIENANMLKKINFPRMCLPITVIAGALVNFGIIFGLFTMFLIMTGNFPGLIYIALIPVLIIMIALSIGLGVTLGVLNVFFRDVSQFFGIFLTFWFWLTPIVYPTNILPENIKSIAVINPMYGIVTGFQTILVNKQLPNWNGMIWAAFLAVLFCLTGLYLSRKRMGEMVDEL